MSTVAATLKEGPAGDSGPLPPAALDLRSAQIGFGGCVGPSQVSSGKSLAGSARDGLTIRIDNHVSIHASHNIVLFINNLRLLNEPGVGLPIGKPSQKTQMKRLYPNGTSYGATGACGSRFPIVVIFP